MKTLLLISMLLSALLAWQITQQHHLAKDTWQCTESRVLYEIDEDGKSKQIKSCVEYKRK